MSKKRRSRYHRKGRRTRAKYTIHAGYRWNIRTHENQQPNVLDLMISPQCKVMFKHG
ncbi:hypothetical protein LCGC14_0251750 [marine sediment metagenome]|uniref:Uncharacterized protein n=1 Tax=marine sediment metagenome TaxID=412755 RepID=A0A0F9X909_9ZZZZ